MPRNLSVGPTGTNRVSLAAQYLVRYWSRECGPSAGFRPTDYSPSSFRFPASR
jgi:hypothetical protein